MPNNALIAIVGDVTPDAAFAQVQRVFGDWAQGPVPAFAPMEPPPPVKRLIVIDKPGSVQTEIRAGHLAFERRHPDHLVMDQVVKILGGEGGNRLQQVLRTQKSLTYGASADLDAYKLTGAVIAETDTRTEATVEAVRTVVDEFFRLQRERVYEGELEGAQDFLAGSFPLSIESPDAIATRVLNQLFYELPLEDLPAYPERVRSVTVDDVQRVAKTWLKPGVALGGAGRRCRALHRRIWPAPASPASSGSRSSSWISPPPTCAAPAAARRTSRHAVSVGPHDAGDGLVRRAVRRSLRRRPGPRAARA